MFQQYFDGEYLQKVLFISLKGGGEIPNQNIVRKVVHHGTEVIPAPAQDFEVGEVSLP
jgi:hypothetical protein